MTKTPYYINDSIGSFGSSVSIEKSFLELFDEQIITKADNTAILVQGGTRLSYIELKTKSINYASYFYQKFHNQQIAGVMMPQSAELMIVLLGLWRIGVTVVPLDVNTPKNRIEVIAKSTGIKTIIVKDKSIINDLDNIELSYETINEETYLAGSQKSGAINTAATLDHIAYIIFTSGSTGVPKGVPITHRSFTNYLQWAAYQYLEQDKDESFGLFSPISSDLVLTNAFLPLISGNTIIVSVHKDIYASLRACFFGTEQVSVVKMTPSHVDILKSCDTKNTHVKKVILGGEKLKPYQVNYLRKLNGSMKIYNEYGPTETTIGCTMKEVQLKENIESQSVGNPIWNTQIYIIDKDFNPLVNGELGEVCIAGAGLSNGYLGPFKKKQMKFVQNPFDSGKKMYLSGDIGKWLKNGELSIIGRKDRQIKLNGNRIELEEIEIQLEKLAIIRRAYVMFIENDSEKFIVAFLLAYNKQLAKDQINAQLNSILPKYMHPQRYCLVDEFPLTTSGKIDEKALTRMLPEEEVKNMLPNNSEKQKILMTVWEEVLGIKDVEIEDNFFHLGGDSIKAMQVAYRMSKLNYNIEVGDILEYTVLTDQAEKVYPLESVRILPVSYEGFSLSPIQIDFFKRNLKFPHHYNHSLLVKLQCNFEKSVLNKIFDVLFKHHECFRLKFYEKEGVWKQQYMEEVQPLIVSYDLSEDPDQEKTLLQLVNKLHSDMNLGSPPLVRVGLFDIGTEKRLIIIAHHLLIDSVSWRIFIEDLDVLIEQAINNISLSLSSNSNSYQHWINALRNYSITPKCLDQISYWTQVDNLISEVIPVNSELNDEAVQNQNTTLQFQLSKDKTTKLLKEANKSYNTNVEELLLVSLGLSIRELFNCQHVPVYIENHGRQTMEKINVNRTIGWFTSAFPFVIPVPENESLGNLITIVKEYLRKVPDKGVGYGILKYFKPIENVELHNLPQVSLNYFGEYDEDLQTSNFVVEKSFIGDHINNHEFVDPRIAITGYTLDGIIHFSCEFNLDCFYQRDIELLSEKYIEVLQEVIDHCISKEYCEKTPSDFLYKGLSRDDVENIFEE